MFLNGEELAIKNFKDYVKLYTKDNTDDLGAPFKVSYEIVNDRWEVAVTPSNMGFQQVSFVNSISTTKGGRHVYHVINPIIKKVAKIKVCI